MTDEDEKSIVAAMREAIAKSRGYASYFDWPLDRDQEEWGVVQSLVESLEQAGTPIGLSDYKPRGRPNDPPDCEARDSDGRRVAIEVTELVSGEAIRAFKAGRVFDWEMWTKPDFMSSLASRVTRKDARHPHLKDPPYAGGYVLVVFTDEPVLSRERVAEWLEGQSFPVDHLTRLFLLLGYDPGSQRCPVFELPLRYTSDEAQSK